MMERVKGPMPEDIRLPYFRRTPGLYFLDDTYLDLSVSVVRCPNNNTHAFCRKFESFALCVI